MWATFQSSHVTHGKAEFDDEIENPAFEGSPELTVEGTVEADDVVVITGTGDGPPPRDRALPVRLQRPVHLSRRPHSAGRLLHRPDRLIQPSGDGPISHLHRCARPSGWSQSAYKWSLQAVVAALPAGNRPAGCARSSFAVPIPQKMSIPSTTVRCPAVIFLRIKATRPASPLGRGTMGVR